MKITVTASIPWWVTPYFYMAALLYTLMGKTPDYEKITSFAVRGIKTDIR